MSTTICLDCGERTCDCVFRMEFIPANSIKPEWFKTKEDGLLNRTIRKGAKHGKKKDRKAKEASRGSLGAPEVA